MTCATMLVMAPAEYRPSEELIAADEAVQRLKEQLDAARAKLRDVIVAELRANPEVSVPQVAKSLTWSQEAIRTIARDAGISPLRTPAPKPARKRRPPKS